VASDSVVWSAAVENLCSDETVVVIALVNIIAAVPMIGIALATMPIASAGPATAPNLAAVAAGIPYRCAMPPMTF
jgi:hypothetical protein